MLSGYTGCQRFVAKEMCHQADKQPERLSEEAKTDTANERRQIQWSRFKYMRRLQTNWQVMLSVPLNTSFSITSLISIREWNEPDLYVMAEKHERLQEI